MKHISQSSKGWIIGVILLFLAFQTQAQCNTTIVDLSGLPSDYTWVSNTLSRNNQCCGAAANQECIQFNITLNPNTVALKFYYIGAGANSSETWQLNCGTTYNLLDTVCVSGTTPIEITFCKSGISTNEYVIEAISKPTAPSSISLRLNCPRHLSVNGMQEGSISWNSITGSPGQYNHYLSDISASRPLLTPDALAPSFIDYEVCGMPSAVNCGFNTAACDTVRVYILPQLPSNINPNPAFYCNTGSGSGQQLSASTLGLFSPISMQWTDPLGNVVSTDSLVFADMAGDYTLTLSDSLTNGFCGPLQSSVLVTATQPAIVNAGADQTFCSSTPLAILNGSVQFANGGTWSGGLGTFSPTNNALSVAYSPTASEITTGYVDLYLESNNLGSGCPISRDTVRINYIDTITLSFNASPIICENDLSTIAVTASGGFAQYTYQWNTGATTNTIAQGAGSYYVTVTDASGQSCKATGMISVTAPTALFVSLTSTNVSTNLACDGTATANPSGGTSPYNYIWSNGQTTAIATALCYGIHGVTVTDANNCVFSRSIVVNKPLCSTFTARVDSAMVNCYGDDYEDLVTSVTGGIIPYTYTWNTIPTQNTATASGLGAGIYSVTVVAGNGCLQVASGKVTQPAKLVNYFSTTDLSTINANDGEATAHVSGGVPGYLYNWSNSEFTATATGLSAGMHYLYAVDANDCLLFDSVYVSNPSCSNFVIGMNKQDISCNGNVDGAAAIYGVGGLAPYSFIWSSGETTASVSGLFAGNYTVTVSDANNCIQSVNFDIIEPDYFGTELAPTDPTCFGYNNGSIETIVFGGIPPYSFQWSNGANVQSPTNLSTGNYSVTATDANGCESINSMFIGEPTQLTATANISNILCFGDNSGAIDLTVNGGYFPYTYQWSTGAATEDLSNLVEGIYAVTVTDDNNCLVNLISVVTDSDSLAIDSIDLECATAGSNSTNMSIHASGGLAPYAYSIDNGSTFNAIGDSIFNVTNGQTYNIFVRDANNCVSQASFVANIPARVRIDSFIFDACYPTTTTTAPLQLFPSGGVGNSYQVSIDNGLSYNPAGVYNFSLAVGSNYSIIIRDSLGCQSDSLTIAVPNPLNSSSTNSDYNGYGVSCATATDGNIDISVNGGLSPYNFIWNNGATTEDLNNLSAALYILTITDANNCQLIDSIDITAPTLLSVNITITDSINCNGSNDGKALATATGGTGTINYLWSNGQNTATATGLTAGTYTLTATDANGCTATQSINITEPAAITLNINNSVSISCNGANDGEATATVSGGSNPLSFLWSDGQNTAIATALAAGTYTVTATDANGCTATGSIVLSEPTALSLVINNNVAISCNSNNDGEATATATGGTGTINYAWSNGQNSAIATGLAAGTYTVTATDANGCNTLDSITLSEPTALSLVVNNNTAISCNNSNDGEATATATGGTGTINYLWSNGQNSATATGLVAGTYTVTVTDANACFLLDSITLLEPTTVSLVINNGTAISCNGNNDGDATATATGGTGAINYAWSNGQNTATATGLTAGTYTLTATDANGCTATQSINITEPAAITLNINNSVSISCNGANDGEATATVSGGSNPLSFLWSDGQNTAIATALAAGTYTVTATDANGCTATGSIVLSEPTALSLVINNNVAISCNSNNDGEATATATGGTGTINYAWSNAQYTAISTGLAAGTYTVTATDANACMVVDSITISAPTALSLVVNNNTAISCNSSNDGEATATATGGTGTINYLWSNGQNSATATGLVAGTYTVTVTDANACIAVDSVLLSEPAALSLVAIINSNYNGSSISCNGANDGEVLAIANGGTGAISYLWSNGQTTNQMTGLTAGTYTVTASDVNGCNLSQTLVLTEPTAVSFSAVVSSNYNGAQISCNGANDGEATASASGGTGAINYLWSDGQVTATAFGLSVGTYTVTVSDMNSCTATQTLSLSEPTLVTLNATINTNYNGSPISCNSAIDGEGNAVGTGGTGTLNYIWSNGQSTATSTGLSVGSYSVTVSDLNGCNATQSILLTEPTALVLNLAISSNYNGADVSCPGAADAEITATATGGTGALTFTWDDGSNGNIKNGLTAGLYRVTVSDANGCEDDDSIRVHDPLPLVINNNSTPTSCNSSLDGEATLFVTGGTGTLNYLWSNGQNTATATGLAAGTYMVTVTDLNGCNANQNLTITEPSIVAISTTISTMISCNAATDGEATAFGTGGTGTFGYLWSNGQNTATATGLVAGNYTVTATDANGCNATQSITLTEPTAISLNTSISRAINCNTANDGEATATASGGTGAFSYLWSNGQTTTIATGLAAGTYNVSATDANGCMSTQNITLTEPAAISLSMAISSNYNGAAISCNGANDGSATATATGGTGTLSYIWSNGQNTATVTGLSAGTYYVTIIDANACETTDSLTITAPNSLQTSLNPIADASCMGFNDGSMALTTIGGTAGYSFLWNNGDTTATITGLAAGSYQVTVTDSNGCISISNDSIINEPALLVGTGTVNNSLCTTANGSIDLSPNGGTAPYSFIWSNGIITEDVNQLNAGLYSVTISDANGCVTIWADTVLQNNLALNLTSQVQASDCYAQNTGRITVSPDNGQAPYSYNWSNGMNADSLTGLAEGSYFVTVTDANGCSTSDFFNLQILEDSLTMGINSPLFNNGFHTSTAISNDGAIQITVDGGMPGYSYLWSNGSTTQDLSGLSAGLYTVLVSDANGCVVLDSILLTEPTAGLPEMPEGISPNNDGLNEKFVIRNLEFYPENILAIYNRWGEELIRFEGYNNLWAGENNKGQELPEGTYFAVLVVKINGEEIVLKGHVDIRR